MHKQDKSLLSIITLYYVLLFLYIIQMLTSVPPLFVGLLMVVIWVVQFLLSLGRKYMVWAILSLLPITMVGLKVFNISGTLSDLFFFCILALITIFGFMRLPKKLTVDE
jgi:hypothetical protein